MYIKGATVYLISGNVIDVGRQQAQALFQNEWVESQESRTIRITSDSGAYLMIPEDSILYVAFFPDEIANEIHKQLDDLQRELNGLWNEIYEATGFDDADEDVSWSTDGHIIFVEWPNQEPVPISDEPAVVEMLQRAFRLDDQIEELVQRLNQRLLESAWGDEHEQK